MAALYRRFEQLAILRRMSASVKHDSHKIRISTSSDRHSIDFIFVLSCYICKHFSIYDLCRVVSSSSFSVRAQSSPVRTRAYEILLDDTTCTHTHTRSV